MLELDTELLRKKLYDLVEIDGVTCHQVLTESGVHNVQKMIDGKTTPTPGSWWKLHNAFPGKIPEPQYVDGQKLYVSADNHSHASGGKMKVAAHYSKTDLSPEEQTLLNLLRRKDPTHIYRDKFMAELLAIKTPENG